MDKHKYVERLLHACFIFGMEVHTQCPSSVSSFAARASAAARPPSAIRS